MPSPSLQVTLCVLLAVAAAAAASVGSVQARIHVGSSRQLVDNDGRHVLMHGLAYAGKEQPPWKLCCSEDEMDVLVSWGFNVVRLGFVWNMYETAPGVYNETFMDGVEDLVNRFAAKGIKSILDANHQDNWSGLYCGGHGIPEFYGQPYNTTEYRKGGTRAYPEPMDTPSYPPGAGPWGPITNCGKVGDGPFGWASTYATYAVGAAAQRLYDNDADILTAFGKYWQRVAKRFMSNPAVVGYELLNEPWLGDVWDNLDLLIPGQADKLNMQRLNQALSDAIREVDDETIIFFEPATGGNILDALPVGYTEGPGGPSYNNRSVLSYHIYCPLIESDMHYHNKSWEKLDLEICDVVNALQFDVRNGDTKRLNVGGFLTEFGAEIQDSAGLDVLTLAMDKMDEALQGWSYWSLTPSTDPSKPNFEAKVLSRTYARAVAGTPTAMSFNGTTGHFSLTYTPDSDPTVAALGTEIFVNLAMHYPSKAGPAWSVDPPGAATGTLNKTVQVITFTHNPSIATPITIKVWPN